jgi:hypothetical protein
MPTYYEILQVSPTATVAEIEAAYETQCARVRRLTNHTNPSAANKSRQGLQFLEQIHLTLTDLGRRAAYDASIDLKGSGDSTADSHAGSRSVVPSVPSPGQQQPADTWICPQCQATIAIGKRFCNKCGQQLARECPQCGELVRITARFCQACGVNMEEYTPPLAQPTTDVEQTVDTLICPRCQTATAIGKRFCNKCGQQLARECPQCGELVKTTETFCPVCGVNMEEYTPSSRGPWTSYLTGYGGEQIRNATILLRDARHLKHCGCGRD